MFQKYFEKILREKPQEILPLVEENLPRLPYKYLLPIPARELLCLL